MFQLISQCLVIRIIAISLQQQQQQILFNALQIIYDFHQLEISVSNSSLIILNSPVTLFDSYFSHNRQLILTGKIHYMR
jgi:hypothetical protein